LIFLLLLLFFFLSKTPLPQTNLQLKWQMFFQLHNAYIRLVCNPFFDPESTATISSKHFDQNIREIAAK
jgi:hypothetical protein